MYLTCHTRNLPRWSAKVQDTVRHQIKKVVVKERSQQREQQSEPNFLICIFSALKVTDLPGFNYHRNSRNPHVYMHEEKKDYREEDHHVKIHHSVRSRIRPLIFFVLRGTHDMYEDRSAYPSPSYPTTNHPIVPPPIYSPSKNPHLCKSSPSLQVSRGASESPVPTTSEIPASPPLLLTLHFCSPVSKLLLILTTISTTHVRLVSSVAACHFCHVWV